MELPDRGTGLLVPWGYVADHQHGELKAALLLEGLGRVAGGRGGWH